MLDPKDIGEWQHEEFYRFIAQAYDKPRYVLHYKTDAPLNIRSIFYVPEQVCAVLSREQGDICPVPLKRIGELLRERRQIKLQNDREKYPVWHLCSGLSATGWLWGY